MEDEYIDREYGALDHVSIATWSSLIVFYVTIFFLWFFQSSFLVLLYIVYCGSLLGDEEEEDQEDIVTMDGVLEKIIAEAPRVAERLMDYTDDFLEFYDSIRQQELAITMPNIWDYSKVDFNVWMFQDFLALVTDEEVEFFYNTRLLNQFYFYSFNNINKILSKKNLLLNFESNIDIASILDPEYYLENFYKNKDTSDLIKFTNFNYYSDLKTRRSNTGVIHGWWHTKKQQRKVMYKRLEESLFNYQILNTALHKGLYANRYSSFLEYFWSEFLDVYKLKFKLSKSYETDFEAYWKARSGYWVFNYMHYDLFNLYEFWGDIRENDYLSNHFYYYNFFITNYPIKKYFRNKSHIYNFNTKASYLNLTYIKLPWHLNEKGINNRD
jgi:hypothetical protein